MDFVRVYTGEDGNARFQTVELAEEEQWTKGFPSYQLQRAHHGGGR